MEISTHLAWGVFGARQSVKGEIMANVYDIQKITNIGDMRMTITEITSDGSTVAITNTDVGMHRFTHAWLQDIDDGAALGLEVTDSTTLTLTAAIGNTQKQMLFALGY